MALYLGGCLYSVGIGNLDGTNWPTNHPNIEPLQISSGRKELKIWSLATMHVKTPFGPLYSAKPLTAKPQPALLAKHHNRGAVSRDIFPGAEVCIRWQDTNMERHLQVLQFLYWLPPYLTINHIVLIKPARSAEAHRAPHAHQGLS